MSDDDDYSNSAVAQGLVIGVGETGGSDDDYSDDSCVAKVVAGSVGENGGGDVMVDNSLVPGGNVPRESIICCAYDPPILTYADCDWKDIKSESIVSCYYDRPIRTNDSFLTINTPQVLVMDGISPSEQQCLTKG